MKQKDVKYQLESFLIVLHIVAGLCLILYPTISNILKNLAFQNNISQYTSVVEKLDENTYAEYFTEAQLHNENLTARGGPLAKLTDEEYADYEKLLNIPGSDVMAYVIIEKINVSLPIYHGTSDAVLQNGIGHLEGTSLPIGGESTHCVISGHRGMPSATLFTNVDRLVIGDTFNIQVLKETLTYEVDQITAVEPNDWSQLQIVDGMDYCTLLTCTPYAVNTHRLLVRGHRIETPEEPQTKVRWYQAVANQNWKLILLIAFAGVLILAIITIIIVSLVRRHLRKKSNNQNQI